MRRTVVVPSESKRTRNGNPVVLSCAYLQPRWPQRVPPAPHPRSREHQGCFSCLGYKNTRSISSDSPVIHCDLVCSSKTLQPWRKGLLRVGVGQASLGASALVDFTPIR